MRNKRAYRPKKERTPLPEGFKTAIKWLIYLLGALLLFSFSTQGSSSVPRAIALFPLAISIAVFEDEVPSCIAGVFIGLLIDISLDKLLGFTAFFLCICCGLISAFFRQFLRKNIINYIIIITVLTAIFLYADYYLFYRIWGYDGFKNVLKTILVPSWLKTLFWSPIVFGAIKLIDIVTGVSRKLVIEEHGKNIDRI